MTNVKSMGGIPVVYAVGAATPLCSAFMVKTNSFL